MKILSEIFAELPSRPPAATGDAPLDAGGNPDGGPAGLFLAGMPLHLTAAAAAAATFSASAPGSLNPLETQCLGVVLPRLPVGKKFLRFCLVKLTKID